MTKASRHVLLAGGAFVLASGFIADVAAQPGYAPIFQTGRLGWQQPFGGAFPAVSGSASPIVQDPAHPLINNEMARINRMQPTYRIGDVSNPNLKQWAKDVMKKDNDEVLAGKIAFTTAQSCKPRGIPAFMLAAGPLVFLQTPEKVVILEEASQQARHIYMNVPHSANPKPSWYGESVGRYEGDTLVVDTIGLNAETFVDSYRTPHTEKLHVIEHWWVIDGGLTLEVRVTVDDPDTFHQPWETYQRYRRAQEPLVEEVCQEGNFNVFEYGIPVAERPDF